MANSFSETSDMNIIVMNDTQNDQQQNQQASTIDDDANVPILIMDVNDQSLRVDDTTAQVLNQPQFEKSKNLNFLDRLKDVTLKAEQFQISLKNEIEELMNNSKNELQDNCLCLLSKLSNWSNFMSPLIETFAFYDCERVSNFLELSESSFHKQHNQRKESLSKLDDIINTSIRTNSENEMLKYKITSLESNIQKIVNENAELKNKCIEKDRKFVEQEERHREDFDTFQDKMASFDDKTVEDYIQKRFPVASNMVSMLISGVTPMEIHNMYLKEKQQNSILVLDIELQRKINSELKNKLEYYKSYSGMFHPDWPQMSDMHIKTLECKLAECSAANIERDQQHRKELDEKQNDYNALKEQLSLSQDTISSTQKILLDKEKQLVKTQNDCVAYQRQIKQLEDRIIILQKSENDLKVHLNCEKSSKFDNESISFSVGNELNELFESYRLRNEVLDKQNLEYVQISCNQLKEIQKLRKKIKDLTKVIRLERTEWTNKLQLAEYEEDINQRIKSLLDKNRFLYFCSHFKFHEFITNILNLQIDSQSSDDKDKIIEEILKIKAAIVEIPEINVSNVTKELVFKTTPDFHNWMFEQSNLLNKILTNQDLILKNSEIKIGEFEKKDDNDKNSNIKLTENDNHSEIVSQLRRNIAMLGEKITVIRKEKLDMMQNFMKRANVFAEQSRKWKDKYLEELGCRVAIPEKDCDSRLEQMSLKHEKIIGFYNAHFEEHNEQIRVFIKDVSNEIHNFRTLFRVLHESDNIQAEDLFTIEERLLAVENLVSLIRFGTIAEDSQREAVTKEGKEKIEQDIRLEVQKEIIKLNQDIRDKILEMNQIKDELDKTKSSKTEVDGKIQQIRSLARKYRDESEELKSRVNSLESKLHLEEKKQHEQHERLQKTIDNQKKIIIDHQNRLKKEQNDKNRLETELKTKSPLFSQQNSVQIVPPVNLSPQKLTDQFSSKKQQNILQKHSTELASSSSSSTSFSTLTQSEVGQKRLASIIQVQENSKDFQQDNSKKPRITWGKASTSGTVSSSQNSAVKNMTQKRQPIFFENNDSKAKANPPSQRQQIRFDNPKNQNSPVNPNFGAPTRGRGRLRLIRRNIPM